jgi:hypothetical protein
MTVIPFINVKVSIYNDNATTFCLSWEHDGARYHVWIDRHSYTIQADPTFKRQPTLYMTARSPAQALHVVSIAATSSLASKKSACSTCLLKAVTSASPTPGRARLATKPAATGSPTTGVSGSSLRVVRNKQRNLKMELSEGYDQGSRREPFDLGIARYAATSFFDQLNSVRSIHMRCRITASLRATATVAFRYLWCREPELVRWEGQSMGAVGEPRKRPHCLMCFGYGGD